jgi:hypothetical protein
MLYRYRSRVIVCRTFIQALEIFSTTCLALDGSIFDLNPLAAYAKWGACDISVEVEFGCDNLIPSPAYVPYCLIGQIYTV